MSYINLKNHHIYNILLPVLEQYGIMKNKSALFNRFQINFSIISVTNHK